MHPLVTQLRPHKLAQSWAANQCNGCLMLTTHTQTDAIARTYTWCTGPDVQDLLYGACCTGPVVRGLLYRTRCTGPVVQALQYITCHVQGLLYRTHCTGPVMYSVQD
jgi:hypothetical protein